MKLMHLPGCVAFCQRPERHASGTDHRLRRCRPTGSGRRTCRRRNGNGAGTFCARCHASQRIWSASGAWRSRRSGKSAQPADPGRARLLFCATTAFRNFRSALAKFSCHHCASSTAGTNCPDQHQRCVRQLPRRVGDRSAPATTGYRSRTPPVACRAGTAGLGRIDLACRW